MRFCAETMDSTYANAPRCSEGSAIYLERKEMLPLRYLLMLLVLLILLLFRKRLTRLKIISISSLTEKAGSCTDYRPSQH